MSASVMMIGTRFDGSSAAGAMILVSRLLRRPLPSARRALGQLPLVAEQHVQIAVVPLGRGRRPSAFQTAADLITTLAAAIAALPAEALLFDGGSLGCRPDQRRIAGAMAFAEGVAADGERDGLVIVHRHAREGLAHVPAGRERIRLAARPFRVHVDQTHLNGGEWILEIPVTV